MRKSSGFGFYLGWIFIFVVMIGIAAQCACIPELREVDTPTATGTLTAYRGDTSVYSAPFEIGEGSGVQKDDRVLDLDGYYMFCKIRPDAEKPTYWLAVDIKVVHTSTDGAGGQ